MHNLKGKYKEMVKERGTLSSVDQQLTNMGLPYNEEVMDVPLPLKFWVLLMEMYDSTWDPLEHL